MDQSTEAPSDPPSAEGGAAPTPAAAPATRGKPVGLILGAVAATIVVLAVGLAAGWFIKRSTEPNLAQAKQAAYADGYASGKTAAGSTGYSSGYAAGRAAGYAAGKVAGYSTGEAAGLLAGQKSVFGGFASSFAAGNVYLVTIGQDAAGNLNIKTKSANPLTPGQCIIPQANSTAKVFTGSTSCP